MPQPGSLQGPLQNGLLSCSRGEPGKQAHPLDEARENAGQESAHCDNVMAHLPHIKSTMAAGIIARTMIWEKADEN